MKDKTAKSINYFLSRVMNSKKNYYADFLKNGANSPILKDLEVDASHHLISRISILNKKNEFTNSIKTITSVKTGIISNVIDMLKPADLGDVLQRKKSKINFVVNTCKNKEFKTNLNFLNLKELEAPGLFLLAQGIKNLNNNPFNGIADDIVRDIAKEQIGMAIINLRDNPPNSFFRTREDLRIFQRSVKALAINNKEIGKMVEMALKTKLKHDRNEAIMKEKGGTSKYEKQANVEIKSLKTTDELKRTIKSKGINPRKITSSVAR